MGLLNPSARTVAEITVLQCFIPSNPRASGSLVPALPEQVCLASFKKNPYYWVYFRGVLRVQILAFSPHYHLFSSSLLWHHKRLPLPSQPHRLPCSIIPPWDKRSEGRQSQWVQPVGTAHSAHQPHPAPMQLSHSSPPWTGDSLFSFLIKIKVTAKHIRCMFCARYCYKRCKYSHVPHGDISVNDGQHILWWCYIIMEVNISMAQRPDSHYNIMVQCLTHMFVEMLV